MTPALFTHVPDVPPGGGLLLDVGCGDGVYASLLRSTGFEYVGVDNQGTPDVLGDAHRLPFRNESIDAVVAISVLEHLRTPSVALQEIRRVLHPGGTFIGTVAFAEPFHQQSYFHHSHLGVLAGLEDAGLDVVVVSPAADWPGLRALAEMGLFVGLPGVIGRTLVAPIDAVRRIWWSLGRRLARGRAVAAELDRHVLLPGGFRFVALRPYEPTVD